MNEESQSKRFPKSSSVTGPEIHGMTHPVVFSYIIVRLLGHIIFYHYIALVYISIITPSQLALRYLESKQQEQWIFQVLLVLTSYTISEGWVHPSPLRVIPI
jgi:hypothetical protein